MTERLIQKLIPDHEQVNDLSIRRAYGNLSGMTGIVCNAVLFVSKLSVGLLSHSAAVIGDSVNSLSDGITSLVTMMAYRAASKPADAEHPFGHGRIEYVTSFIVAEVILLLGIKMFLEGISAIIVNEGIVFRFSTVIILVLSILVKIWLYFFNTRLSEMIGSPVLKATALDSLNDVATSGAVLVSVLLGQVFPAVPLDGIATVLVSVMIIRTGYEMAKELISRIIGKPCGAEEEKQILEITGRYPQIIDVHDLILHDYGPGRRFGSMHAEMDGNLVLRDAHTVIDRAEEEILKTLYIQMTIHPDPVDLDDPELEKYKEMISAYLKEKELTAHDIRLENNVLKMDIVLNYNNYDTEEISRQIQQLIAKEEPGIHTEIVFQYGFTEGDRS